MYHEQSHNIRNRETLICILLTKKWQNSLFAHNINYDQYLAWVYIILQPNVKILFIYTALVSFTAITIFLITVNRTKSRT